MDFNLPSSRMCVILLVLFLIAFSNDNETINVTVLSTASGSQPVNPSFASFSIEWSYIYDIMGTSNTRIGGSAYENYTSNPNENANNYINDARIYVLKAFTEAAKGSESQTGLSVNGQTWVGSTDGFLVGKQTPESVTGTDGVFTFTVQACTVTMLEVPLASSSTSASFSTSSSTSASPTSSSTTVVYSSSATRVLSGLLALIAVQLLVRL